MKRLQQILMLLVCLCIVATAAIQRDGCLWGHRLGEKGVATETHNGNDTMRTMADGTLVVNTSALGSDIRGYGGPVPLEIYISKGRVTRVRALANNETPAFFGQAKELLGRWNGMTIDEAARTQPDAVSGATYSSRAIIANMHRAMAYASANATTPNDLQADSPDAKTVAGLVVVMLAAIVPLLVRNRRYRTLQLVLNVAVLGFWCGTFLSWSLLVGFVSGGIDSWMSLIPIVMMATAFAYPLFGKKNYYCSNVCPCGSLQDLAGMAHRRKWHMSQKVARRLDYFRQGLFNVLVVLLVTGIWTEWMDYEVFSAFVFQTASAFVLVLGVVVVVLSLFVPRPYCRFVCPTGTLLRLAENRR